VGKQVIERDNTIINELMSIEQKPIKQNKKPNQKKLNTG
jgi:hypothetical protein